MYENNILEDIKDTKVIVIASHTNPDGDAVGSTLAFAQAISKLGKKPVVLLEKYAEKFDYIKGSEYIYNGDYDKLEPEIFFAFDCADKDRLGKAAEVFDRAKITYNIDHHISNDNYANVNIVNPNASSASEIAYDIIKGMCDIDLDIAVSIYSGVVFDTGGFRHNSTSENTHKVAGELVACGIDTSYIHTKVMSEHTTTQVKIFIKALNNSTVDNKIAFTTLSDEEIRSCGADYRDLDGIVEYLLNIKGVEVAILITERGIGNAKVSLRSNALDVNNIAEKFGGGGHKLAAGISINGGLNETMSLILKQIKEHM